MLWLLNPFVQNANVFEFHMLVFAPFFLFWVWYFYLKRDFPLFLLFSLLALSVREDVSFVVFMMSPLFILTSLRGSISDRSNPTLSVRLLRFFQSLAMTVKKEILWVLVPILLSTLWFFGALGLIGRFAPSGSYKFLFYYSWIGATPFEIIQNALLHPIDILSHMLSYGNLEMTLGFFIPFLFLPLLSPLLLLLAAGPLAQVLLGAPGGSAIILQTHYSMLFLPALFLALIASCEKIFIRKSLIPIPLLLGVATIYGMMTLGPIPSVITRHIHPAQNSQSIKTQKEFLNMIPGDASLATTYALLTPASSRTNVYSLHYAFLGIKQYSQTPYALPEDTEYLLIDFDDLVSYSIQFQNIPPYREAQADGYRRLRSIFERYHIAAQEGSLVLFQKGARAERPLYTLEQSPQTSKEQEFSAKRQGDTLRLIWNIQKPHAAHEVVEIAFGKEMMLLPAAWGLAPDAFQKEGVRVTMFVRLPSSIVSDTPITIRRFIPEGYMTIDGKRSIERRFLKQEYRGEQVIIRAEPSTH